MTVTKKENRMSRCEKCGMLETASAEESMIEYTDMCNKCWDEEERMEKDALAHDEELRQQIRADLDEGVWAESTRAKYLVQTVTDVFGPNEYEMRCYSDELEDMVPEVGSKEQVGDWSDEVITYLSVTVTKIGDCK